MIERVARPLLALGAAASLSTLFIVAEAQTPKSGTAPKGTAASGQIPRTPEGKPDFSGIWQSLTTADWDIQDHASSLNVPPGMGIVEGNELPYKPEMLAKKKENWAKRTELDGTTYKCFMPGVPRATYMPHPFQIVQSPNMVGIRYEFARATRLIRIDSKPPDLEGWPDFWMGDSRARWEGDTLVVDVKKIDERTWFDRAGNFHSDQLHVVERYSFIDKDHIQYEATITDPVVFTRPWKISLPLYRRIDKNVRVLEHDCAWHINEDKYKDAKPH
jgi:hypothetical protein